MARDAIDSQSSYLPPETLKHCHGLTVRAKNNISLFYQKIFSNCTRDLVLNILQCKVWRWRRIAGGVWVAGSWEGTCEAVGQAGEGRGAGSSLYIEASRWGHICTGNNKGSSSVHPHKWIFILESLTFLRTED